MKMNEGITIRKNASIFLKNFLSTNSLWMCMERRGLKGSRQHLTDVLYFQTTGLFT